MILEIDSHKIHYTIEGEGPAVLLLHGFLESLQIWDKLVRELFGEYKVITLDLPGHGLSDNFISEPGIDKMAELVNGLLEKLTIDKAVIIGHSMGGYVGLAITELFRNKVQSLCLFHSMASADSEEGKKNRDRKIKLMKERPETLIKESIAALFWEQNRDRFSSEIQELYAKAIDRDPYGYVQALEAMKNRPDRNPVLRSGVQIFYLCGEHDPLIPYTKSLEESKNIENGSIAVLKQSGHMGFIEEEEAFYGHIKNFLSESFKHQ